MQKRFLWADSIRILAIYLVILTHSIGLPQQLLIGNLYDYISYAISRTCVPLFVMLSGALLLSKKESGLVFYKKRALRLLLPWGSWSFIYLFLVKDYLLSVKQTGNFFSMLIAAMQSFWFLPMIFALYILTPFIRIFVQNCSQRSLFFLILIWFFAVSVLPYQHDSMGFPRQVDFGLIRQTINFIGYYLLGHFVVNLNLKIHKWLKLGLIPIVFGLVWFFITLLSLRLAKVDSSYAFDFISPGVVLLSLGIFAFIYNLINKYEVLFSDFIKQVISNVGRTALGVYFIHVLLWQTFLKQINVHFNPIVDGYINALIIFVVSFFVISLFAKIRFVKKVVT